MKLFQTLLERVLYIWTRIKLKSVQDNVEETIENFINSENQSLEMSENF